MLMTLVLPGSAQLTAGSKQTGRVAIRVVLGLVATTVLVMLLGLVSHSFVFWLVSNTVVLGLLRFGLIVLAVGWAYLFVDAWRLGDPLGLRQKQRLAMVGLNGVLTFSMVGSLLFVSHVVGVQRGFLAEMFGSTTVTSAHAGRFNVLLLGGDSGKTRWGLRPDSLTVASIDAGTGKTILFGLPRNMTHFTFRPGSLMAKQFPRGYNCDECELNSLVTWAGNHTALFKGFDNPGVEATTEAVEGITGLKINYYAMVNLQGFRKLTDAVGGVTIDVRQKIPKGALGDFDGHSYIEPGVQKLKGDDLLWYARSRMAADDYSRMARQKCVMNAMLQQLSPKTVVLKFGAIADAGETMLKTDIPGSEVDRFIDLALKARKQPIRTVSFVPPVIETYKPDLPKIHRMVQRAIKVSEGKTVKKKTVQAAPKSSTTTTPSAPATSTPAGPVTGGSYGSLKSGYLANQSTNLNDSC
ncbi:LytR family transcriptional regulator [Nocardioides mangrovicus]|uniref:LytR family transcriptional regulator n=2 Tax=Nocardioides mangrovicus TaxID=2478913 RepID=A0A3L8P4U2_9ACTN|nr:LytR family transcriptional regulator [Nocardioides mangrovicus]